MRGGKTPCSLVDAFAHDHGGDLNWNPPYF
jgi:hypothetical protein